MQPRRILPSPQSRLRAYAIQMRLRNCTHRDVAWALTEELLATCGRPDWVAGMRVVVAGPHAFYVHKKLAGDVQYEYAIGDLAAVHPPSAKKISYLERKYNAELERLISAKAAPSYAVVDNSPIPIASETPQKPCYMMRGEPREVSAENVFWNDLECLNYAQREGPIYMTGDPVFSTEYDSE